MNNSENEKIELKKSAMNGMMIISLVIISALLILDLVDPRVISRHISLATLVWLAAVVYTLTIYLRNRENKRYLPLIISLALLFFILILINPAIIPFI
jgi:cytochrome bd-type quinol oxidase subunit 2